MEIKKSKIVVVALGICLFAAPSAWAGEGLSSGFDVGEKIAGLLSSWATAVETAWDTGVDVLKSSVGEDEFGGTPIPVGQEFGGTPIPVGQEFGGTPIPVGQEFGGTPIPVGQEFGGTPIPVGDSFGGTPIPVG